eukprot:CAMPEP_0202059440 /NCGR_PEP_ID=MMETSP0963-20130614/35139_1 /ASSEMBLY_ACC=CAM_ASM_000494 /TAXON_ID=4773 /ORGANISM="Schizochytrium aggregatum, Strain ATCC28209" /LENGTH=49 /DNA_ID= /DNA_START= /DNA_END= /DNA_ORIENTATION=
MNCAAAEVWSIAVPYTSTTSSIRNAATTRCQCPIAEPSTASTELRATLA